jgi:hypothetical protein
VNGFNVADYKAVPRLKTLQPFQLWPLAFFIAQRARPRLVRRARHKHGHAQPLGQRSQPVNVIGVFVSDQDRGKRVRILAQRLHALEGLASGDAGIDQNAGARAGHQRTIPPAPRRQHG